MSDLRLYPTRTIDRLHGRFARLYGEEEAERCMARLRMLVGRYELGAVPAGAGTLWSEKDAVLITYADMIRDTDERPLGTLKRFADERLDGVVSAIHILPFFPYSSDDGFSVIDYRRVHPAFGDWEDIQALGERFGLMFDLVLNHCSRKSAWAKDYVNGILPARAFFLETDPAADLSAVVRPRPHPLLTPVQTRDGERHLWTTFSDDQLDLNFANPDVLFEFLDILLLYIRQGMRIVRLDAIAYLWKEIGTSCIHLPQTHEVVKLFRDVLKIVAPRVILLTETNVPHAENMSYFGEGDEAHMIYNFTLPPLLLHTLLTEDASALSAWAGALPDPGPGRTYFNFTASHDGVGVRPLEGIVPPAAVETLCAAVLERGGRVSTKRNSDGTESPYELNVSYVDALRSPTDEADELAVARFLASQNIALSLRGLPGIYFHSLVGTRNDEEGVRRYGYARAINRKKWARADLLDLLDRPETSHAQTFSAYRDLLRLRRRQPAFHPDAPQRILDLGSQVFGLARRSIDGRQSIVALHNVTGRRVELSVGGRIPELEGDGNWLDLVTGKPKGQNGKVRFAPFQCCWLVAAAGR